jgi:hypothetical protein
VSGDALALGVLLLRNLPLGGVEVGGGRPGLLAAVESIAECYTFVRFLRHLVLRSINWCVAVA